MTDLREAVEPEWLSFDEAAAFLALPDADVARLLLSGLLSFEVVKRSPNDRFVLRMDVRLAFGDLRDFQRERWSPDHGFTADGLVNRAAMKWGLHPTRTSPGVRGKSRR